MALRHVSRVYVSKTETVSAVDDLSLTAHFGEFIAIMGPSGSGKSTLINLLAGLDSPTSGEICIEGELVDCSDLDVFASLRLNKIGVVFQDHHLLEELLVRENVSLPLELLQWQPDEIDGEVKRRLEAVGVASLSDRLPSEVSGGQRQRVAIARALAPGPKLVLADEPISMGGADAGPAPFDFLMAGLGACTAMTLRMYAERKALPLTRVSVRLDHDKVVVDGNHPLAGMALRFHCTVNAVRAATAEELEHGHVHGAHGHHH